MTRLGIICGLTAAGWLASSGSTCAGQTGLHRDGNAWVETTSGSEALGEGEQLKIACLGNVMVRGSAGSQVEYTLNRKVRAHNEAQARDALQEAGISLTRQGRFMRLLVNDAAGPVDLQVKVPRSLRAVLVGSDAGNIDVADIDGGASAQTAGGNIRMSRVKGNVDVNTAGGTLNLGEIGGSARAVNAGGDIQVDSIGGEAHLETAGGNIFVQRVGGVTQASTAGGKVHIGQAGGKVFAETAGGTIDIGTAAGPVTAHNQGGGPIVVAMAKGGVHCESASGAIKVSSTNGVVHLETASGSVIAQLEGSLGNGSYIETASGDITVYLAANLAVTIQAHIDGATRAQSIVSDFPDVRIRFDGGSSSATAAGSINGGGPTLRLEGNGGVISIKRR